MADGRLFALGQLIFEAEVRPDSAEPARIPFHGPAAYLDAAVLNLRAVAGALDVPVLGQAVPIVPIEEHIVQECESNILLLLAVFVVFTQREEPLVLGISAADIAVAAALAGRHQHDKMIGGVRRRVARVGLRHLAAFGPLLQAIDLSRKLLAEVGAVDDRVGRERRVADRAAQLEHHARRQRRLRHEVALALEDVNLFDVSAHLLAVDQAVSLEAVMAGRLMRKGQRDRPVVPFDGLDVVVAIYGAVLVKGARAVLLQH